LGQAYTVPWDYDAKLMAAQNIPLPGCVANMANR
jgi:hypothetical protein